MKQMKLRRDVVVFAGEGVDMGVDFGGDGEEAEFGEGEAGYGLCFGGGCGEAGADCRVAVPVCCEGEEFAEFGEITHGDGSVEQFEVAVKDCFALVGGYEVGDEGEGSKVEGCVGLWQ